MQEHVFTLSLFIKFIVKALFIAQFSKLNLVHIAKDQGYDTVEQY